MVAESYFVLAEPSFHIVQRTAGKVKDGVKVDVVLLALDAVELVAASEDGERGAFHPLCPWVKFFHHSNIFL